MSLELRAVAGPQAPASTTGSTSLPLPAQFGNSGRKLFVKRSRGHFDTVLRNGAWDSFPSSMSFGETSSDEREHALNRCTLPPSFSTRFLRRHLGHVSCACGAISKAPHLVREVTQSRAPRRLYPLGLHPASLFPSGPHPAAPLPKACNQLLSSAYSGSKQLRVEPKSDWALRSCTPSRFLFSFKKSCLQIHPAGCS